MDVIKNKTLKLQEMKLNPSNPQIRSASETVSPQEVARTTVVSYRELPGLRHETKDVLKQMQANIQTLEDLTGRLGFAFGELRSLIVRS